MKEMNDKVYVEVMDYTIDGTPHFYIDAIEGTPTDNTESIEDFGANIVMFEAQRKGLHVIRNNNAIVTYDNKTGQIVKIYMKFFAQDVFNEEVLEELNKVDIHRLKHKGIVDKKLLY